MTQSNGQHVPDGGAEEVQELIEQAKRTSPLDPAQQESLLQQAARGDRRSHDRLVEANLELVIRLAAHRTDQGLPLGDLVQEGSIGLVAAIRDFGAKGVATEFDAYATERINAQLDAALNEEAAAVHEAELLMTAAADYERVQLVLARELHRLPAEKEMAEKLEWTIDRLRYVAEVVADARRRHDEELLAFIDPDAVEVEQEDDDLDA